MNTNFHSTDRDALTEKVIGAAIAVHRALGPGLLESAYEECLACELQHESLHIVRQVPLALTFREVMIPQAYLMDIVVEQQLIIELKAVEKLLPIHEAQLLTYMKLSRLRKGLLLNFNVPLLKDGIKRMVL
jgi:GxxExxY protein